MGVVRVKVIGQEFTHLSHCLTPRISRHKLLKANDHLQLVRLKQVPHHYYCFYNYKSYKFICCSLRLLLRFNYQNKNCAYTHQSFHSKLTHHSLTYHSAMKCNQSIHWHCKPGASRTDHSIIAMKALSYRPVLHWILGWSGQVGQVCQMIINNIN